jgi:hypothetical protein
MADSNAHATSYVQLTKELVQDSHLSPLIQVSTIGHSSKHKRAILLVQVGVSTATSTRILILCRQHGDEPSGTEGALSYINKLAVDPNLKAHLKSTCLFFIPMVNPDGAEADTRLSGIGADLNRDWGIFQQPETIAVRNAVKLVMPSFILDVHSWDKIDPFQQVCLEGPRQAADEPKLLRSVADLQARAAYGVTASTGQNVLATTYGKDADYNLAHRYFFGSDHIASLLFETAPGPNSGPSLSKRTALVLVLLKWLVDDTEAHPDAWHNMTAAEPHRVLIARTSLPSSVPLHTVPSPVLPVVIHKARNLRYIPLAFACVLIVFIIIAKRTDTLPENKGMDVRYRRLRNTSLASVQTAGMYDTQTRRRRTGELILADDFNQFRDQIEFGGLSDTQWLGVSEQ